MQITKDNFQMIAEAMGWIVEPEFKFCPTRKFKSDWKVSKGDKVCLVEYEGLPLQANKKSRHTTVMGYTNDCNKYNLAQILGYPVFRYTVINLKYVLGDLEQYFKS
jgi:hypothetical protein